MKNFYLKSCLIFISFWGFAQNTTTQKQFNQIPIEYQSHPELGKTKHGAALNEVDYELVHERTKFSRTFLNTNTTKTTVQSSVPLHYLADNGFWQTIDYKLSKTNNKITYPAQNPFFESSDGQLSLNIENQRVRIKESNFVFISANGSSAKTIVIKKQDGIPKNDSEMVFKNVSPNVDKNITLYNQAFKYSYLINDAAFLPEQFEKMLVEEVLTLPAGFSIRHENANNQLAILNQKGEEVFVFQQPVVSDSKVMNRNLRQQPYEAKYNLVKLNETTYKIQIKIDGSWLKSSERVFPINIDPVVTVSNNGPVNSCFLPTYQQSTLLVAVPAGQTVLSSNISYDFVAVAGSGAWMSDQRGFVSGPNGQTAVMNGVGGTEGLYTTNITGSPIGNVVSTGQITYTFNFARNWGGTGCNATYDFVNRREITVTYGTIEYGNGPLLINEYSASNRNFNDGFNRNEDWIELYNSSPTTYFNLAGYYVSNNINNPTKWQIQDGVIPPNSRVLIFCSSRDISSGTVLHASFDLTQTDPDEIVIADPSGNVIQSLEMFTTQTNHSYGRTTDGASTWSVFSPPTPGQTNTNGFSNYATKPTISVAPGKYLGPITVALSSSGTNEQVRYTTNGSTPTATSTLYSAPISITENTVLRARAFSTTAGILPGFIETNSYFINDNSSLPVVSLSGDADLLQLLNGNQIEPIGYLEYFESDGTFVDENMGDFDKHGNDSWAYNQRGIDFISRDDHGYKRRLEHQFFNTSDRINYRRLILKAAGSDNYPHQSGGAHLRDVFVQKVSELSGMELDERRSIFVSLFVNGQYWGVYDLREKVDDNQYTDYYYGQDYKFRDSDEYIQYIKTWGATLPEFGNQPAIDAWDDLTEFVQNNDMALEANYNYVDGQLNIDSLIDYFVLNSYMVNKDWLNWNTSWWRGLDPSGGALKWRYALWDCDGVLGHYINYTGIPDISANAAPCNVEELEVGVGHTQTIGKLIEENPIVRQRYITRYADLLNTHLSCEQVTAVFDSIVAVIAPEMPRQIQRWGGSMATWQANVLAARNFLLTRCSQTINTGLVECYDVTGPFATTFQVEPANTGRIKMNSEWFVNYPASAQVFGNIETLLKAEAYTGYEFSHWVVDGAVITPDAENPDIVLQISQATSVTAYFTEVTNAEQALYYWHFNTLETPVDVTTIQADYNLISGAAPLMTYTGTGPRDIDANSTGSIINIHFDELSGKCARVRNPSQGRSLDFDLPTTGYKNIKFDFAVQRTNEGMLTNNFAYSVDGVNFVQTNLNPTSAAISTEFSLVQLDFSAITAVNDNPNFKVRITFEGNTTGDNGNNRYDNITLKGVENELAVPTQNATTLQVFPNPFSGNVQIISSEQMIELSVFDMIGKNVWQKKNVNKNTESIDLESLSDGVYLLKIKTPTGSITHKLVKQ
ncbi:MAG: T9SS type A sorting domain-containing protein [Flavobacterium sp.]|uniref:CotH kinase family protein n=1 Tax=Flavobacterium sp. TaxID=239 RepID=UPI001220912C|nr:CotH kinase family protein [Flavobacterium sp.]RZJ67840.1 MAG: T9SS type A sorting domain-containing protein [Flavobacterium sp.]